MRTSFYRTPAEPDRPPPLRQTAGELALELLAAAAAVFAIHMAFAVGSHGDRHGDAQGAVTAPAAER